MQQLSRPPSKPPDMKYVVWLLMVLAACGVADLFLRVYQIIHK